MQKSIDTTGFDRSYRRGVVLGLSLAELFIILVFLLLLVLSISGHTKEEINELLATKDEEIERLSNQQNGLTENLKRQAKQDNGQHKIDSEKNSELLVVIATKDEEIERLNNERNKLADNLERQTKQNNDQRKIDDARINELVAANDDKDKEIERLNNERNKLADNLERQTKQNNDQRKIDNEKINELVAANADKDQEIKRLNNERNKLADNLERQAKQNNDLRKVGDAKINELAAANADKDKEIEQLNEKINELRAAKDKEIKRLNKLAGSQELDSLGQDSPCWYKLAKRPNGEDYEKHLYIFDIRISDHSILVKDTLTLTPRWYQRQKRALGYDHKALNKELDYEEFIPAFEALKIAGRNKEIRDRRCTFTVRLWDTTSPANKKGYIEARHIVEDIFIILPIQHDPWPH